MWTCGAIATECVSNRVRFTKVIVYNDEFTQILITPEHVVRGVASIRPLKKTL